MEAHFLRSQSLNNIPALKVKHKSLAIIKDCSVCQHQAEINGFDGLCKKCATVITIYNRYAESNIPLEYWPLQMEKDFVGDKKLLEEYIKISTSLKDFYCDGKSICLAGSHGVGKSTVINCLLKKAAQQGYQCLYTTLSDIVNVLLQGPNSEKFNARRELTLVDFLALDEVDPRFFNQSELANETFARSFESILRTRLQNKLPTFLATNSPNIKESFHGLFKASLSSILNNVKFLMVFGSDFRENK